MYLIPMNFNKLFCKCTAVRNFNGSFHYVKRSVMLSKNLDEFSNLGCKHLCKNFHTSQFFCSEKTSSSVVKSPESPLLKQLQARIKFGGPLTIYDYMKEVLINPISGYYTKKDEVFGSKGDYITSPDISQMFGELIGVWVYYEWYKMGSCKPLQLVEFGPGRGTLMQDILRTLEKIGLNMRKDIKVHLIELSHQLCDHQEESICGKTTKNVSESEENETGYFRSSKSKSGTPIFWHHNLVAVPHGFSIFIAHEFFDTFPVHKMAKTKDGWRELLIDIDDEAGPHHLRYVLSRHETPATNVYISEEEKREEVEVSPDALKLADDLATRIERNGGAALIIDYGHDGSLGDTLRAFKSHKQISPLMEPGTADITADVDFKSLKNQISDRLVCYGPVQQGFFLKNMGIELRLTKLLHKSSSIEEHKNIISGYKMLVEPKQMGERFKVFAMFPSVIKDFLVKYPPSGFYRNFNDDDDNDNKNVEDK